MTAVEWIMLGLAVANIVTGLVLKARTGAVRDLAAGLDVLEGAIEDNKVAECGEAGRRITSTIRSFGPAAVQAVDLARSIKEAWVRTREAELIRQEMMDRAAETARRS